jgi:hypothetical protein
LRVLKLILFILTLSSWAESTIHSVLLTDSSDERLGVLFDITAVRWERLLKQVAKRLDQELNVVLLADDSFHEGALIEALDGMEVEAEDSLVFYYTGHGFHRPGKSHLLPTLKLDKAPLALSVVVELIKEKGAGFNLIVADCCNHYLSKRSPLNRRAAALELGSAASATEEGMDSRFNQLFLQEEGTIVITSAGPGEFSWYNPEKAGVFSYFFLRSLRDETKSLACPSWYELFYAAAEETTVWAGTYHEEDGFSVNSVIQRPQFFQEKKRD